MGLSTQGNAQPRRGERTTPRWNALSRVKSDPALQERGPIWGARRRPVRQSKIRKRVAALRAARGTSPAPRPAGAPLVRLVVRPQVCPLGAPLGAQRIEIQNPKVEKPKRKKILQQFKNSCGTRARLARHYTPQQGLNRGSALICRILMQNAAHQISDSRSSTSSLSSSSAVSSTRQTSP